MTINPRTTLLAANERNMRMLRHVHEFRLTTINVAVRAEPNPPSRNVVRKLLDQLCHRGFLRKFILVYPTHYFVLGELGSKALGQGNHRTLPRGPQSLPQDFALLNYAIMSSQRRSRLSRATLRKMYEWMPSAMLAAPHCQNQTDGTVELVRVDLGGPPDHVARKCANDIRKRCQFREFSALVASGAFRLVVITGTPQKSAALRGSLDRHEWPKGLRIHMSVVPELLNLTTRK